MDSLREKKPLSSISTPPPERTEPLLRKLIGNTSHNRHSSSQFNIFHHISSHFITFHHISSHFITFHHISSHFITFHHNKGLSKYDHVDKRPINVARPKTISPRQISHGRKDLARKVEMEQVSTTQEVRDQINAEIRRFQDKAQADLENVRSNMTALHQKEVSLLQDGDLKGQKQAPQILDHLIFILGVRNGCKWQKTGSAACKRVAPAAKSFEQSGLETFFLQNPEEQTSPNFTTHQPFFGQETMDFGKLRFRQRGASPSIPSAVLQPCACRTAERDHGALLGLKPPHRTTFPKTCHQQKKKKKHPTSKSLDFENLDGCHWIFSIFLHFCFQQILRYCGARQELTGSLKLKVFEIERAGFTMEEVSRHRQRLETENTRLGAAATQNRLVSEVFS